MFTLCAIYDKHLTLLIIKRTSLTAILHYVGYINCKSLFESEFRIVGTERRINNVIFSVVLSIRLILYLASIPFNNAPLTYYRMSFLIYFFFFERTHFKIRQYIAKAKSYNK